MILPIYFYGQPVLRKMAEPIEQNYPELDQLIANMYQTMYHSEGVGLAAPQIGLPIRLFVVDASPLAEEFPELAGKKMTFINPEIIEFSEEEVILEEGCLSLPGINERVSRSESITITYLDEQFVEHTETFSGFFARIVQHEYDHLEGHVFTDSISPLRRTMIAGKLNGITKGKARCHYRTK